MYLLVEFSYRQTNFLDNEDIIQDDKILVEAPDNLCKSEFKDFVIKNYINDIINIVQYSNVLGQLELSNFEIENVSCLVLLNKTASILHNLTSCN